MPGFKSLPKTLKWGSVLLASCLGFSTLSQAADISKARNLPEDNKILYIMGQDTSTLSDYYKEVLKKDSDMPAPGGVTLYTAFLPDFLRRSSAAGYYVSGIEGPPASKESGDVDFKKTLKEYDKAAGGKKVALAVGLYISDDWKRKHDKEECENEPLRAIAGVEGEKMTQKYIGKWRQALNTMIREFKKMERPVYLRIGYEFDGPWNCYNQELYKQAFRYIKERIDHYKADNIATVWQSATWPDDDGRSQDGVKAWMISADPKKHLDGWYPGDDVVDWIGLSYFAGPNYEKYQWSCPHPDGPDWDKGGRPWTYPEWSPRDFQDTITEYARSKNKPVMIAESAPQGFRLDKLDYSCVAAYKPEGKFKDGQAAWDAYFTEYFAWINKNKDVVRAFSYINTDWEAQDLWGKCQLSPDETGYCTEGGYWGDTRIQGNPVILNNFKAEVKKPQYKTAKDLK